MKKNFRWLLNIHKLNPGDRIRVFELYLSISLSLSYIYIEYIYKVFYFVTIFNANLLSTWGVAQSFRPFVQFNANEILRKSFRIL